MGLASFRYLATCAERMFLLELAELLADSRSLAEPYQYYGHICDVELRLERLEKNFGKPTSKCARNAMDPHFLFNALNTIRRSKNGGIRNCGD